MSSRSPDPQQELAGAFSMSEARGIVADLFRPNPVIYWIDFLVSIFVAMGCFEMVYHTPDFSPQQIAFFLVSTLLFYRSVMFIHELTHLKPESFKLFRIVWNVLCGIPCLIPSFAYDPHSDHHRGGSYGTERDGEYLSLGVLPPWHIALYLGQVFFIPLAVAIRFLIVTPLTWVSPRFHRFVLKRASSLVIDLRYVREPPDSQRLRVIRLQEFGCFVWAVLLFSTPFWIWTDEITKSFVHLYMTALLANTVNSLRTAGAHRFINGGGKMTHTEQLLDSWNYPRWPLLTGVWAPIGTRFHALHHLFPTLPYHNMAKAHHRLMRELPADSPYRETVSPSLVLSLVDLFKRSFHAWRSAGAQVLVEQK
ncbi:MAG: fatty acid desaturase [Pirellulaceae bacterium]|jgi:fatty acid desaturase|nr:fatty acid desaturase [Pirellulaceae bacterium]MDP7015858.1 fatty acid desaturase [Pirellulaceae bacterium]